MEGKTFFEVSVSPAKKQKMAPIIEEKELLILGLFKPIPKLEFNDVKVSTLKTKAISVYNPSKCPIKVNFEVGDGAEEVKIDPSELEVGGGETVDVNVLWVAPSIPASFRYTIYTRSATHKKLPHIILVCHSVGPKIAPNKKKKNQVIKKTTKVVNLTGDIDRRLTYNVKIEKPRAALQNVHNTLDALNKNYVSEHSVFTSKGTENLPPCQQNRLLGSTPPASSNLQEKISLTVVRKRKSSHEDPKIHQPFSISCADEEDPLTSTPNKLDSPKFRDSLESDSFDTISTIGNNTLDENCKQPMSFEVYTPMSKTFTKYCDTTPTPLKLNFSRSSNDIDKAGFTEDKFDADGPAIDTQLTMRPFNHRSTYTISSSRMAQSMNDIASYFKQSTLGLANQSSKSTSNISNESKTQCLTFLGSKTSQSDDDRTFIVPLQKNVKEKVKSNISVSMDRLENSNASSNVRPRSFSTSITYLDSETMAQFNESPSLNDSKYRKAATIYSAFFHEPENIPVNEDPFSRKNMEFHTKEWLDEREYELLNWLNALMTPPTGWEGISQLTIESEDIAKIWHAAARAKTLLLPPSKESLATQSLLESGRLRSLRKAASQLFNSQEIRVVHDWLRAQISKKTFEVKNDVDLGKNQGSKVLIVKMLCRYNPLWLRIGLEAIYKTTIHLQSINDFQGIVIFLQQNLLANESVEKKVASKKNYKIKMDSYRTEMNAFVVEKFLLLIFFLDRAKSRRMIPFDPCLFMKNSPIKVSEELLDEFIREFMKCTGGMKNNMKRVGYVLTYHQTCLDEYDYSIKTRLDLRDGIRLARAVGIILKRNDLGKLLRAPAVSLLQKVNNVQVALNTLKSEGFSIIGDIAAKDIAMGHREKTLSLLWQILNKFIKTRYEFSAKKIQIWWKKKSLYVIINRRIRMKEEERKAKAATIIQSCWRGRTVRKWFSINKFALKQELESKQLMLEKLNRCAALIQKKYREYRLVKQCQLYLASMKKSVITIQRWYRASKLTIKTRAHFALLKSCTVKIQRWYRSSRQTKIDRQGFLLKQSSAILIQQYFRSYLCMKKCRNYYLSLIFSVIKIQRLFRAHRSMKVCRRSYLLKRNAAIKIQCKYRAYKEMVILRNNFTFLKTNTLKIQNWYRACQKMKESRKSFLCIKKSVLMIENRYSEYLVMKKCRENYLKQKISVIKIQQWYRGLQNMKYERQKFLCLKKSTITIQQRFKSYTQTKKLKSEYLIMKSSAIKIQNWFRACQTMKLQRQKYKCQKQAAITIQRNFRVYCQMKKCHSEYLCLKTSALKIQMWYRNIVQMKTDRKQFIQIRKSVVTIQNHFHAYILMKTDKLKFLNLKTSTIRIQIWFRACQLMKAERQKYLCLKKSTTIIQNTFRSYLQMKKCRSDYLLVKSSTIKIQNWYRACKLMKSERQHYLLLKSSAAIIQHKFRGYLLMKKCRYDYLKIRLTSIKIQNWYKACKLMKNERQKFLLMKHSAEIIQSRLRAYLLKKKCRSNYLEMRSSSIKIQNWFRACKLMKTERQKFLLMKHSAEIIQSRLRAYLLKKKCMSDYLEMRSSSIKIQNWFRACKLMQIERQLFLNVKNSTLLIQGKFRGYLAMKKCQSDYMKLKSSTRLIQLWYRALQKMRIERQRYLIMKGSAQLIQQRFRGYLVMKKCRSDYLLMKSCIIIIQNWFRACRQMKSERKHFLNVEHSVVKIQQKFRGYLQVKQCRSDYLTLKSSAILIQKWYRASQLMRHEREKFLKIKSSAALIQNKYRAYVLMKLYKTEFLNKKASIIKIQRWYRGVKLMQSEEIKFLQIKQSALIIQNHFRSYLMMKSCKCNFIKMRTSAIKIQKWFRSVKIIEAEKLRYIQLKQNIIYTKYMDFQAVKIQRWYRSICLMREERERFLNMRQAALVVQLRFRNYRQLKTYRNNYILMKSSAIKIQRMYRAYCAMREERKKYLALKKCVVKIQRHIRNNIIQKNNEKEWLKTQEKAAIKIQSLWRCFVVRKKYRDLLLARKAKADLARQEPLLSEPLRQRYVATMFSLKNTRGSLKEKYDLLLMFYRLTKYSRELSSELCVSLEFHRMLWTTLHNANRAPHYFDVCDVGLNIVMNLAKANALGLFHVMKSNSYTDILLGIMMKYLTNMPSLFCKCATIIWVLIKEPIIAMAFYKNEDILKKLNRFKVLCSQSQSSRMNKVKAQCLKALPLCRIDGGYCGKFKPTQFQDNLFAIETVLGELKKYSKLR